MTSSEKPQRVAEGGERVVSPLLVAQQFVHLAPESRRILEMALAKQRVKVHLLSTHGRHPRMAEIGHDFEL
jgi:hypothetical protein